MHWRLPHCNKKYVVDFYCAEFIDGCAVCGGVSEGGVDMKIYLYFS